MLACFRLLERCVQRGGAAELVHEHCTVLRWLRTCCAWLQHVAAPPASLPVQLYGISIRLARDLYVQLDSFLTRHPPEVVFKVRSAGLWLPPVSTSSCMLSAATVLTMRMQQARLQNPNCQSPPHPQYMQALGVLAKLVGNVADCGNTIERWGGLSGRWRRTCRCLAPACTKAVTPAGLCSHVLPSAGWRASQAAQPCMPCCFGNPCSFRHVKFDNPKLKAAVWDVQGASQVHAGAAPGNWRCSCGSRRRALLQGCTYDAACPPPLLFFDRCCSWQAGDAAGTHSA